MLSPPNIYIVRMATDSRAVDRGDVCCVLIRSMCLKEGNVLFLVQADALNKEHVLHVVAGSILE